MINNFNLLVVIIVLIIYFSQIESFISYIPWNLATRFPRTYYDIRGDPFYSPLCGNYGGYCSSREMINPLNLFPWIPNIYNRVLLYDNPYDIEIYKSYPTGYNANGTIEGNKKN